ncbi:response regulator transcription factor [Planosporangium thailandense]|uniref:Response regulator transcription factor n=1 Tax=Planosporangium thailandense TaxID=765197 RepID=A0ABX0Y054_9ACTN|nr:response regulator transcription factor [Planosporangium thailandense]NJC71698.1 response regulator transcription factor [Planosporangium thailandense]
MRILVVDDEPGVRESVSRGLGLAGFDVRTAPDGAAALDLVRDAVAHGEPPDAVVLDVMMPGMDGIETCRALRAEGHRMPVLMMTARDSGWLRSAGLRAGADDYLVKPVPLPELTAHLRALLPGPGPAGGLTLGPGGRLLAGDGREITLSSIEYRLAEAFLDHRDAPLGKAALFEHVWHYDFGGGSKVLDPYLESLAAKLATVGWCLVAAPDGYRVIRAERTAQPPLAS